WRPALRVAFEQCARPQRAGAAAEGQRPAQGDGAVVAGAGGLRAAGAGGANRGAAGGGGAGGRGLGRGARARGGWQAAEEGGGGVVTVVGSLAQERVGDWRAGRRVRMPVQLRRPSRYLDPGVPDHERELARRGTTLVGTVKSGALVEVLERGSWWSERLAAAR